MSKRNKRRSQPTAGRKKRGKPPQDGRPRRSGWLKTCLWATLGLIFAAVVALQLASPNSMPSAMMRRDYQQLTESLGRSSRLLGDADEPVWEKFRLRLTRSLSADQNARQHDALANLMTALVTGGETSTGDDAAIARTDRLLQVDRDNLVARLAVGVLRDRSGRSSAPKSPTGMERLARLRSIVEQPPGYRLSTLHRQPYYHVWQAALEPFVRRRDVRLSLSRSMPEQFDLGIGYNNTYEGLLTISTTLAALSETLRAAGHHAEAETCDQWVTQMALGVIESETDVAAQRLCTRLLLDRLGADTEAAHNLQTMIRNLDQRREAAPRDLTGQSFRSAFGAPALDPPAYRRALVSLIIVLALMLSALGAGVVLVLAIAGTILHRLIRQKPQSDTEERFVPAYVTVPMLFIPAAVTCALIARSLIASHLYGSALLGLVDLCTAVAAGALGVVAVAGFRARKTETRTNRRATISFMIALLPFVLLAVPPSFVARTCQRVDMFAPSAVVVLSGLTALLLIGLVVSPARLRTIAATAAVGLCVNTAAALVVMPFHRSADHRHQQAVVDAGGDAFSARLGKDWQETYLQSTRQALRVTAP